MNKLEIGGSVLYFLAKVLLLAGPIKFGWGIFILGVPFWVAMLLRKRTYIFAGIEAINGFILILNLARAFDLAQSAIWTYAAIAASVLTIMLALVKTGRNITQYDQILEATIAIAFSLGTTLFTIHYDSYAWMAYAFMHLSAGLLLERQKLPTMGKLQWTSLGIAVSGAIQNFK